MELIHIRLKEELERLGLKPAAAAKLAGEPDSQGLRDVLGGRKRLSAELLAALDYAGVDVAYVLTGKKNGPRPPAITSDESVLLDTYRSMDKTAQQRILAFVLGGAVSSGSKFTVHGDVHGHQIDSPKGGVFTVNMGSTDKKK